MLQRICPIVAHMVAAWCRCCALSFLLWWEFGKTVGPNRNLGSITQKLLGDVTRGLLLSILCGVEVPEMTI